MIGHPVRGAGLSRRRPSTISFGLTRRRLARVPVDVLALLRDLLIALVKVLLFLVLLAAVLFVVRLSVIETGKAASAAYGWVKDALTPDPVPLPRPAGPRTLNKPLHLHLATDISTSMREQDADNVRYSDTTALLTWAADTVARPGDTVELAYFNDSLEVGATSTLAEAAKIPVGAGIAGSTAFLPVADWVRASTSPDAYDVAIIITDGDASDAHAAAKRLAHAADRVIVVQIAHHDADQLVHAWQGVQGIDVMQATTTRPQAVAAAIAERLLDVTGQNVSGAEPIPTTTSPTPRATP